MATVAAITRLVTGRLPTERAACERSARRFFTELLLGLRGRNDPGSPSKRRPCRWRGFLNHPNTRGGRNYRVPECPFVRNGCSEPTSLKRPGLAGELEPRSRLPSLP